MQTRTPMVLITGSLGSGKTTLLRRLLASSAKKLAVLINEFGEIGIDGRIIEGQHTRLIELAGGCVCCELAGEFVAAVEELLDQYQPELIVLEATGVAEADALVYEVEDDLPRVRLDCVLCLVDGWAAIRYPQVGHVGRVQLQQADIVLINKADLIAAHELAEVEHQVKSFNPDAAVLATDHCRGAEALLLAGPHGRKAKPPAAAAPSHLATLQSFSYHSPGMMDADSFSRWADSLPPAVFRAKGFVVLESGNYLFNFVAGRWDLEEFAAADNQLVFIGPGLAASQKAIIDRLKSCER